MGDKSKFIQFIETLKMKREKLQQNIERNKIGIAEAGRSPLITLEHFADRQIVLWNNYTPSLHKSRAKLQHRIFRPTKLHE
jgi:hypothetical protein